MSGKLVRMGEYDSAMMTPREVLEDALEMADELDVVLLVGETKDGRLWSGGARGDPIRKLGMLSWLQQMLFVQKFE